MPRRIAEVLFIMTSPCCIHQITEGREEEQEEVRERRCKEWRKESGVGTC